jgi:hypothetical protein
MPGAARAGPRSATVPPRDRIGGELGAVLLERSGDGRFDSTGEHVVRHVASVRRPAEPVDVFALPRLANPGPAPVQHGTAR